MEWSCLARSVWGKLDPASDGWMPLVRHLEDAAAVADYLWESFLSPATRGFICESLGLTDDQGRRLVCWLAGIHDIGKATPAFAAKALPILPQVLDRMRDHGLDARPTPEDRQVPHATAGQLLLDDWLAGRYPSSAKRVRSTLTCVVGCHHGATPSALVLQAARNHPLQLGDGRWHEVRVEILDKMTEHVGAGDHLEEWLNRRVSVPVQVLLTGIVIMADWIASNTDYFPYVDDLSGDRLGSALDVLDLPEPWLPIAGAADADQLLVQRFPALEGCRARPLQESLLAQARNAREPGLFIVEGPMGVGKTEAALLAAEVLAERFGLGGVFVGLPTMATADPMFDRVQRWLRTTVTDRDVSITLAHGKAALNDNYAGLLRRNWSGRLYSDSDSGDPVGEVVVNEWLRGRKRNGLASFVIGTIDQSLFAALKAKHIVLRHLGLVGKVVIIDEVHAADDYMREYLKRLLCWLGAYRTPVILMSATLPPGQRDEFLRAYAEGSGSMQSIATSRSDDYPRISMYDHQLAEIAVASDARVLDVSLGRLSDDLDNLVTLLRAALVDGGCAAVICNTVTRAQETFAALRDEFGSHVRLVHSRFIAPDRARREARLVQELGPTGNRPDRLIVVGTQVLEQSLDVDFDLMVTDLAPADLMLQRAGRLHRHARKDRPEGVAHPKLWIRGVVDWQADPPQAVRGSRAVYGSQRILHAASVLKELQSIRLPDDIPRLVRLAYDPEAQPPDGWQDVWHAAEDQDFRQRQRAIARAHTYLIDSPAKPSTISGLIDVEAGDPDRAEEQGKSQVRDSDEGLEVIALWRTADDLLHLPAGIARYAGAVVPEGVQWGTAADEKLARAMAACTLRLPASLCYPAVIDSVISDLECMADYSGWQQSRWIAGQLVLVFDDSGVSQVAGRVLSYDSEQGLRVSSPEESGR
ncbi:CRISPR-associated helicase Cas3' [Micropruina sp.]|uniref:CRISPR-associated helicase Cas3' n=1 Tax=Micropruina sp. TaxID=2737536 RepID=UPI0039E66B77